MLFQVSKHFTGREFAAAVSELSSIIAPTGRTPDGNILSYGANGATGDVELTIDRDGDGMQMWELTEGQQRLLMLWKLKYAG